MVTNISNISIHDLKRAVALREQIEELEQELAGVLGGSSSGARAGRGRGGRRTMSAAAREKIAAAQRLRWAKWHKGKGTKAAPKKGRRKMSAAGRARIAAAARARWAKAKASGRRTLAA